MQPQDSSPDFVLSPLPPASGLARARLLPGTLWRLGPWALARYARHRLAAGRALPADTPCPAPPFLCPDATPPPGIDWCPGVPADARRLPALAVPTDGPFDIRLVWEAGRLVDLASLPPPEAEAMVRDFLAANPPFRGPHWACGQEAAIRLAHLLEARAAIGGNVLPGLRALVGLHRARIAATLDYAMAQDNNHAISEASGLWAASLVLDDAAGAARGRALLQRAVLRLFAPGGAFSQHSMRYHAVALEMAAFGERTARAHGAAGLEAAVLARLAAGAGWLRHLADPGSGRAWRVGHDDSSRLFGAPADDLRPVLARAGGAFPAPAMATGSTWLDLEGGFASLRCGPWRAFLRLPVHRFRPSQADALHLDLWQGGCCLSGDPGTYLYNANADPAAPDLARTAAHNTVGFDEDDQMPRLSRFLYAAWLRPAAIEAADGGIRAAYRDWKGRSHGRAVRCSGAELHVSDRVEGSFGRAVLRWRLPEAAWRLDAGRLSGGPFSLEITGAEAVGLVRLPVAARYGRLESQPVLEAATDRAGTVLSRFALAECRPMA